MRRFNGDGSGDFVNIGEACRHNMPNRRVTKEIERERMSLACRILDKHKIEYGTAWGNTIRCPVDNPEEAFHLAGHLGEERDIIVTPVDDAIGLYMGNLEMAGYLFDDWRFDAGEIEAIGMLKDGETEEGVLEAALEIVAKEIKRFQSPRKVTKTKASNPCTTTRACGYGGLDKQTRELWYI